MKRFVVLSIVLVAALLSIVLVGCAAVQAAPPVEQQSVSDGASTGVARYITVVGVGQISLTPDMAEINVGAEAIKDTVAEAKAEVDRQITAILSKLDELGIAEKDIQTSGYSIYFEREPFAPVLREGTRAEPQGGYRVSSTLRVRIRDVDQVGNVLDAVVEAGANQVYGVHFTVADDDKWQSKARANAVADAKARADELARLSGVEVGEVLSVSEVIGSMPGPVSMAAVERAYGGGGIAPGELQLSTQIQITFAIK